MSPNQAEVTSFNQPGVTYEIRPQFTAGLVIYRDASKADSLANRVVVFKTRGRVSEVCGDFSTIGQAFTWVDQDEADAALCQRVSA